MTSFAAPTGAGSGEGVATSFAAPGVSENGSAAVDDKTTVLELGGRTYTLADIVTKITNADKHIETLTAERAEDRKLLERVNKVLEKQTSIEDVLGHLKPGGPPAAAPAAGIVTPAAAPAQLTAEQIAATVKSSIQAERTAETETQNFDRVAKTLTATFGAANVDAKVAEQAAANGLSVDAAVALAKKSPDLFLKMFNLSKPETTPRLQGNVNTGAKWFDKEGNYRPTGYWAAKNTRESVTAYTQAMEQKLAALGNR